MKVNVKKNITLIWIVLMVGIFSGCSSVETVPEKTVEVVGSKGISYYDSGKLKMEVSVIEGKRQGPWKEYYESGAIKKEGRYLDDKLEGTVKEYTEDGRLIMSVEYKGGIYNGSAKIYNENGSVKVENIYLDGREISEQGNYFNEKGMVTGTIYRGYKLDGGRESIVTTYYESGGIYQKSVISGEGEDATSIYKEYSKKGALLKEENYKGNKKDGVSIYYNEDGSIQKKEVYINGELTN